MASEWRSLARVVLCLNFLLCVSVYEKISPSLLLLQLSAHVNSNEMSFLFAGGEINARLGIFSHEHHPPPRNPPSPSSMPAERKVHTDPESFSVPLSKSTSLEGAIEALD